MQLKERVILKQGSTFRDISGNMSRYVAGTEVLNFTATTDALYIGSGLPFNHRFFDVDVFNTATSSMDIKLWCGNDWVSVAEVVDTTSVNSKTLAQSSVVMWVPDKYKAMWNYVDNTEMITDLSGLHIYDLYWMKITFSVNLSATTAMNFIGHKFSVDADLFNEYPEFNDTNLMTAIKAGKTDWDDQTFAAAEYIIQDLRKANFIRSRNQLLDYQTFKQASIHKTAQIIFNARGFKFKDQAEAARVQYKAALAIAEYNIDQNMDAILSTYEEEPLVGYFTR
jgi:hypothetical protein